MNGLGDDPQSSHQRGAAQRRTSLFQSTKSRSSPTMLVQGATDARVMRNESNQIRAAVVPSRDRRRWPPIPSRYGTWPRALTFRECLRHAPRTLSERRLGITYALIAYGMWGLLPLYLKALKAVPLLEVVSHRILWSAALLVLVGLATRQLSWLQQLRERPRLIWTLLACAAALSVNWLVFIWAVSVGRVVDGSLGYFINPLVSVVLAVVVLKERLRPLQWAAVGVAALGVLWLTVLAGQLPWIGLALASSFGLYGLLRKTAAMDSLGGLTLETLLLLPVAGGYLLSLASSGQSSWSSAPGMPALLIAAGPLTALPLLSFVAGARRIPLSLVGILQYLGPTLQLLLGVAVFHEPLPTAKLVGFGFIWLAVALYTIEGAMLGGPARGRSA